MKHTDLEFIRDCSTAVLWRIEDLFMQGEEFDKAKDRAIKQAEPAWRHLSPEVRDGITVVSASLSPYDMSSSAKRKYSDNVLSLIEADRGRRAGPIERLFFRLTGMTF